MYIITGNNLKTTALNEVTQPMTLRKYFLNNFSKYPVY